MASFFTPTSRRVQGRAGGRRATETLAEVAQSVEHRSEKPGVVSSILTLGTFFKMKFSRRIFLAVALVGFFSPPFQVSQAIASPKTAAVEDSRELSKTVYVTKSGKKYHRAGCRSLKKKGTPTDLNQARRSKTPCKVCKPLP